MDFIVVGNGKRLMIVNKKQRRAGPARQPKEYFTHTSISCPPRSLVGLGSEQLAKMSGINNVMELVTTSSGGRLRALCGAVVWRTPSDFCKLMLDVVSAKFSNGRLVCEAVPRLNVSLEGPIGQVIRAHGKVIKLTNRMLTDIRDYVTRSGSLVICRRLVRAAEENELPLCVLRHVLSFLGSPPDGATRRQLAPRYSPMAVWRTMTRLQKLRLDSGLGGHARKRHHTSECAGVPAPGTVRRPPRRRHPTAPTGLSGGDLLRCNELVPLPAADHPLDRHMADRTVRFCSRPAAEVWDGSVFSRQWQEELATQQRCHIISSVTFISSNRQELEAGTHQRCLKQKAKRLIWKRIQEQERLLRQLQQQQHQEPEQQQQQTKRHPYPQDWSLVTLRFFGIKGGPPFLGNNMVVFPPLLRRRQISAAARWPRHKFECSQRPSLGHQGPSQSLPSKQLQEQLPGPQRHGDTATEQEEQPYSEKTHSLPSSTRQTVGSSGSQQTGVSQQPDRQVLTGAVARVSRLSSGGRRTRLSLCDHRVNLLKAHYGVLQRGRRPYQKPEKPLPPRSPLASPTPAVPPRLQTAPSVNHRVIRPGLWLRLLALGPSPPLTQETQAETEETRPSTPQAVETRPLPPQIQHARLASQQTQQRPAGTVSTLSIRSPSLWGRLTELLGLVRSQTPPPPPETPPETVEVAQEAIETCWGGAITEHQHTPPPLWLDRPLDAGC